MLWLCVGLVCGIGLVVGYLWWEARALRKALGRPEINITAPKSRKRTR